ncbi:SPOR domain-containing protein [Sphingobium sp.]|uniref:SPOR domain-containing protein n=1 Tax=Sphingobium sp. TaxID=1912891 RepID=UPI002C2BAA27|nr:SPOR domain-containing protein [Sphingobium sp.]HUD94101.1 SPOR domain-containing protein [Sphingobium sp.]
MKPFWRTMATGALLGLSVPALADVKTGVDAWQQGDYAKAIGEWRPLADAGDPDAQFNMGQAYKLGRGVQADMKVAIDWYRKAATQGHMRAEDNLGLLMFQQGDRAAAIPYLQRAAMRGEPRAQYIVGTALFNGDLVDKDWVRAYALMTRASASGLSQASTSLAQMDKYIPEDQRKQGLAMAAKMEQGKGASFAATEPEPIRAAPAPVRAAELPASTPPRPASPAPKSSAPKPQIATAPPPPKPATPANALPKPATSGGWRVQLGAFGEEGNARALWNRLTGKVSGLSAYQLYLVKAGAVTRVQAGPIASSVDASRLCSRIKAAGADCMPKKI